MRIARELKPLESQIEIAQNIARMQKAGAQAEYFSCDVADPASVAVLVERVASRFGKIEDRKSTRLNSSHVRTSYAVFCLKKKTTNSFFTSGASSPFLS